MLHTIFREIVQMSMAVSIIIILLLLLRPLLSGFPKIFSYALWGVVLVRLLIPFSLEIPYRSIPSQIHSVISIEQGSSREAIQVEFLEPVVEEVKVEQSIYPYIWMIGIVFILLYCLISYVKLRYNLRASLPYDQDEDIYFADPIQIPFVVGAMYPKIYLPSSFMDKDFAYILLHEQYHIRRKDHIVKPLALLACTFHWFNPFVWISFYCMAKDMELSCDEAVLQKLNEDERNDYAAALLELSTGKKYFSGISIAFGEGDAKSRIKNIVQWKKSSVIKLVFALTAVCVISAVCILIPKNKTMDHPYKWIEQTDFERISCENVDDIFMRDLVYILEELHIYDFEEYESYSSEIVLHLESDGQQVRLIYGNGLTVFQFEDSISDGKVWGVENKDLEWCMKEIKTSREANLYVKEHPPQWKPEREDVYEMRERVMAGVGPEDDYYLTELVKVMNLELESTYLYEGQFEDYEEQNSTSWDYLNYDKYRLYLNGVKKRMQNGLLMEDLDEMLAYLDIMEDTHNIDALRSFYYKLHDLDYFLLRYWADEPGYIYDRTTIATYYGALHIYDEMRVD